MKINQPLCIQKYLAQKGLKLFKVKALRIKTYIAMSEQHSLTFH